MPREFGREVVEFVAEHVTRRRVASAVVDGFRSSGFDCLERLPRGELREYVAEQCGEFTDVLSYVPGMQFHTIGSGPPYLKRRPQGNICEMFEMKISCIPASDSHIPYI